MRVDRRRFGLAGFKGSWRPRTRKGWLITMTAVAASVAVKLTIGAGVILFLVHALSR